MTPHVGAGKAPVGNGFSRLGILGGTLDPIHRGHLDAAAAAHAALALDEILIVPAHDPPHKDADPHASAFHRFAMVALAIADRPGYRVSDIELTRQGLSYTALTLRDLTAGGWQASQMFFIIGADAFAEIATWYDYPAILDACHYAVIARPGCTIDDALARNPQLRERVGTTIHLVDAPTTAVSSSELRARLASGESIDGLVAPAVARHIQAHNLYRSDLHGED